MSIAEKYATKLNFAEGTIGRLMLTSMEKDLKEQAAENLEALLRHAVAFGYKHGKANVTLDFVTNAYLRANLKKEQPCPIEP